MKIHIYAIWFPTSDRSNPHYVGVSDNLERRMLQHLKSKSFVGNALNKYNNWVIKKLHTCKTYEEAFKIEIEEIRNFNCVAPNGYNLTRGGEGCNYWKGKKNYKLSEKLRGRKCPKHSKFMRGNQYGEETQFKLGNKHTEKWKKEESKRKKNVKRLDQSKFMKGNQFAKGKNLGNQFALKNGEHTKIVQIKKLKTRIAKLEQDL